MAHDAHTHDSHAADTHDSHGAHHVTVDDGKAGAPGGWPLALVFTVAITVFMLYTILVPQ